MARTTTFLLLVAFLQLSTTTSVAKTPPSTFPHAYPGMPTTPYGPDWQAYYEVTTPLPNITFPLPRAYAGSVSVDRPGHPNDTLFFVAFEREDGSLSATDGERANEPWAVWLNGGPGSSSMDGLFNENGPLRVALADGDTTGKNFIMTPNPYSWTNLTDMFYVDQPVGTGYSTSDRHGYVADQDQVGEDFTNFLANIVAVFPSLKARPLFLTGESYAGRFIPYIAKTIVAKSPAPVNLTKMMIGDGAFGNRGAFVEYSTIQIMQTYPQLFGFDTNVYEYFVEQYNLCGYNLTLSYPSPSPYPTLRASAFLSNDPDDDGDDDEEDLDAATSDSGDSFKRVKRLLAMYDLEPRGIMDRRHLVGQHHSLRRRARPPPLSPTGVIDAKYQCHVLENLQDYAENYTVPWTSAGFDRFRISDALVPAAPDNPSFFLNDPTVRAAFHAPKKTWTKSFDYPFNSTYTHPGLPSTGDPSPESQLLLSDLSNHVSMIFFSGNDDALAAHRGTELAIQNTTFGGIRGFTVRPSTPFSDVEGRFAGIIHQERGVTYALVEGAGHKGPKNKPSSAYALYREFVVGSNQTGLVVADGSSTTVVGGIHTEYEPGILTASGVLTGSYRTEGTYTWPTESWAAWGSYMATRTAQDAPIPHATDEGGVGHANNGALAKNGAFVKKIWSIQISAALLFTLSWMFA
ncbi:hypothetical protein M408DRAFT_24847 [Serendipita vermifera MAFF 305830]|uniref:Carboxypeptidase n=1 Tax=Serendipita vermifera MAFF 305830 TaxID=933852 RepID=A0A0C3ARD7_SERVB|nr:hypothetical protein M408DRAFT_24847 [Serendipita vermifera MAFF 305830]